MSRLALLLLLGALIAAGPAAAQAVIFVDVGAPPGGDGTSWASAFQDLQDALAVAEAGDEVWVAEGVYKPTSGSDRTATFTLRSGVALYGGFDGTETSLEERDWAQHVTILSGDIGVPGDSTDNSYHVVTASGVDRTAVLDGLTVERGRGGGATPPDDRGAGLLAIGGSPTIRNCRFRFNSFGPPFGGGAKLGGGIYVEAGSPLIEDTAFEDNSANSGGGLHASGGAPVLRRVAFRRNGGSAVVLADGSTGVVEDAVFEENRGRGATVFASSPVFRRCVFRDNVLPVSGAGTIGAGAFIDGGAPRFEDCLFERLRTNFSLSGPGGAVHVRSLSGPSSPAFVRTTFRDNTASRGAAAYVELSDALFLFCRFEANRALAGGALYVNFSHATVVGGTFVGNRAEPEGTSGYGGAIKFNGAATDGSASVVASALFAGNFARHGGAVVAAGTGVLPVEIVNVTLAGNAASQTGGGVWLLNAAEMRLKNVVQWGNGAPEGAEVHVAGGAGPTVERALIQGGCPTGATCTAVLDEDPLFVRPPSPGPDGTWGTEDDDYGDLRLLEGSPGLDYGLTSLLPPDVWDLDGDGDTTEPLPIDVEGNPRVQGEEVDLGAYERPVGVAAEPGPEPAALAVAVHPNPVRGEAMVMLDLPEAGEVAVALYDVLGRRVAVVASGHFGAGRHEVALEASLLPAGVYLVRAEAGGEARTARLTRVR